MMFFFFTPAGATYVQKWDPEKEKFYWTEMAPIPGSDHEEEERWMGKDSPAKDDEQPVLELFPEIPTPDINDAEEVE